MIKKILKINNSACPNRYAKRCGRGFVILFAVTISSILLAIALGVANIALKEIRFGTNARDTNNAFFAADTAIEYALFLNKDPNSYIGNFIISQLGGNGEACATSDIIKDADDKTTIAVRGYSNGGAELGVCSQGTNSTERQLE